MSKLVIIRDGVPHDYSVRDLLLDNPEKSFPARPSNALLAEYGVYPLVEGDKPQFDRQRERLRETMEFAGDHYVRSWVVEPLDADAIARNERLASLERSRRKRGDLAAFADPVFFKWQRGEATKQEWLDAVAQVEEWYS